MHTAQDPYDAVAYPSFPYPDTHPDRLAAMAILHGLSPVPVERCRVLEIACNEGANLIPMAYAIPGSEFVGFDLARLPVERGQERIRELGLKNAWIFAGDLLDAGKELGQFDYIIAHGLYAWVPAAVRERLMAVCGELLTANGVAFVSYNALPGGHLRRMTRDMMLYGVKDIEDPQQRVPVALGFLHLVVEARPEGDAYRLLIEEQLKKMEKLGPEVTYHDEMTDAYHPVHFFEFVEPRPEAWFAVPERSSAAAANRSMLSIRSAASAQERSGRRHPETRADAGLPAGAHVPGDARLQSGAGGAARFSGGAFSTAVAGFTSRVSAGRNVRGEDLYLAGRDQDGIEPPRRDRAAGGTGGGVAARAEL